METNNNIMESENKLRHEYNPNVLYPHIREDNIQFEFWHVEKYCRGLGFDIGAGTNRLSPTVLTTDWYPHTHTDLVWNCCEVPDQFKPYPFQDNRFDFVFSSHCIEDFEPNMIQRMFDEMLRMVKVGGYLVILVPDIATGRYPGINEVFTEDDDEVKNGTRQIGELKGNPAHRVVMGVDLMNEMASKHSNIEIVQCDTLPKDQMTMDFVVKKLA